MNDSFLRILKWKTKKIKPVLLSPRACRLGQTKLVLIFILILSVIRCYTRFLVWLITSSNLLINFETILEKDFLDFTLHGPNINNSTRKSKKLISKVSKWTSLPQIVTTNILIFIALFIFLLIVYCFVHLLLTVNKVLHLSILFFIIYTTLLIHLVRMGTLASKFIFFLSTIVISLILELRFYGCWYPCLGAFCTIIVLYV